MALITSDRARFPNDPWQLVETVHLPGNAGTLETLFSLGNGHLGIRGAHWAAADAELPGSFINGFHETWDIKHAENAFGFARTGQRILYVPDANNFTVIIDGEPLSLEESTVLDYRRSVDFATGIYECRITWQCRSGATVTTTERRAVGYESRGALGISLEVAADRDISADVTSSVINRQDQPVEDHSAHDPRRAGRHAGRVLLPLRLDGGDGSLRLSWEAAESKQRLGMAVDHWTSAGRAALRHPGGPGRQQRPLRARRQRGRAVPCWRRASATPWARPPRTWPTTPKPALKPVSEIFAESEAHYRAYWTTSDIVVGGPDRAPAGHPLEPLPARPGHGLRRCGRHPGQGRDRLRLRGPLLLGPGGVPAALPDLHQPRQRPPGSGIPPRPAARGEDPRQGAQRGRRALPVAHHQRPRGQRLLRGRHGPVPHRRRDRLRHQPVHLGQRGHRIPGHPGRRSADRDRPDVGLPGLLRQGRALPHPRRHRPRRVHRRRQRQPVHQRHGPLQPARRGGAGPPGDRRRRTPALGAGRQPHAAAVRRGPPGPLPGQRLHDPGTVGLDARRGPSTRCCCTSTRW